MANTKEYSIKINGLTESINAVDSLNKQLDRLEQRMNVLSSAKISTGGGSKGTSKSSLSEEEKLAKQIEQIDAKREAYSKKIYQNYLAAKDVLKETVKDQQQIAASERLQANTYSNTMKGLKDKLADIKNVMQTTDIGSDLFKKYTAEANEITNKLKELEEAYGQFGRNVGNYKSAVDGFDKIKVNVGETVREFDNYRQAMKTLRAEQFQLSQTLGQESKEYKDVHNAIKQLESDYKDLSVSSKFMDNMLDSMQTVTAAMNVGVGLSNFFGIDDDTFNDAMRKMIGISQALQGLEVLKQQWQSNDSWLLAPFKKLFDKIPNVNDKIDQFAMKLAGRFTKGFGESLKNDIREHLKTINLDDAFKELYKVGGFDKIDKGLDQTGHYKNAFARFKEVWDSADDAEKAEIYVKRMTGALYQNTKAARDLDKELGLVSQKTRDTAAGMSTAAKWVKNFTMAVKSLSAALFILYLPEIIQYITDLAKSFDGTKKAAEQADQVMNTLNRTLEKRVDLLGASYLKGEITSEQYLNMVYKEQNENLNHQIDLLRVRADAAKDNGFLGMSWLSQSKNADFSGNKFTGETTVKSGMFNQLTVTVKDIKEVEEAWRNCVRSISKNNDYLTENGKGVWDYFNSLFATVRHTEDVMKGMGNIKLSDTISQFQELQKRYNSGAIDAEQYAKALHSITMAMNNNDVLTSVIANLDKYIPDEKVREAVQNIINEIYKLDDAFNMTSAEQVHHWEQVRIDAMKDGLKKTLEQIKENERYEIQQQAKTNEQRILIQNKYERQRQDAREKAAKENLQKSKDEAKKLIDADNQLIALRIANMKEGFDKRMAELDNQKRLELQKLAADAKDNKYIKVQEMTLEINKKYDKLILDEKRKWAFETLKVYEDLAARIDQLNSATMETEASTATQNVQTKQRSGEQSSGYSMITPTSYDNYKVLEQYYAKVVQIKKEAADKELEIEKERLAKAKEYEEKEEELRHSRLVNADGGEYITQLRAGLISQEQYDKLIEKENDAHYARMNAIDKQYTSNLSATTQDTLEEEQKLYSDYYGNIINNLRSDKAKIDEIMSKQPVTDKQGWGVVNTSKANQNYTKALEEYDKIKQEIVKKQQQLSADLQAHRISPEDFAIRQKDLDQEMKAIDKAIEGVKERQKMLIADFLQSIQQYIQAGMESLNTIMQAVWQYQDNAFDDEQERLDKLNEELDKKLGEQQEIVERHKDAIDSIEDELATARGDRRQHLIDQLNAEMAAQREAAAQEKKIQKEKEAAQRKQDELEKERKKAQYKRDQMQAIINGAMAVTYAAMNAWPVPAIPMMALAAATTAAQLAIMASNKPYRTGGQLEGGLVKGKRHNADGSGGVPVGNTGIFVEGDEMIIRRESTMPNIDLLNYINNSKHKLSLDDFIDFYSSGKVKKNIISMSPKTKFADGGVLPSLSNDIDINDRLLTAFEDYSNRPVQVAVVDINDRQAQVKNVQVMAGLTE